MITHVTRTAGHVPNIANLIVAVSTLILSEKLSDKDDFFVVLVDINKSEVAMASDTDCYGKLIKPHWKIRYPELPTEKSAIAFN